jgi:hypothetical protein
LTKITTVEYFVLYNLAPAGLYMECEAKVRRLRYRYTAGYAHLAPSGAIQIQVLRTSVGLQVFLFGYRVVLADLIFNLIF